MQELTIFGRTISIKPLLTKKEAMDLTGLKRSAFDSWVKKSGINPVKYGASAQAKVMFVTTDIIDFIENN